METVQILQSIFAESPFLSAVCTLILVGIALKFLIDLVVYFRDKLGLKTKYTLNREKTAEMNEQMQTAIKDLKTALEQTNQKLETYDVRNHAQNEILIALAREQLVKHYQIAEMENKICPAEFDEWLKLYNAYSLCGGNGTASKLKTQLMEIPVTND